ncbi:MAG: hypothetical protein SFV32_11695 [Opitutaceae bacterium]|nr:hypothetical protein [Opitutaceae bacterium]
MRRRAIAILVFLVLGIAVLVMLTQCRRGSGKPTIATLTYVNEASSGWRITLANTSGGEPRVVRIPPLGEVRVELAPGAYVVSQVLIDIQGQTLDKRQTQVELKGGRDYRWRLLTLLSRRPMEAAP